MDERHVALVTGASSGIGAAIARRLAANGVVVLVGGRDEARTRAVADAIRADGGSAHALALDVRERASVAAAVDAGRRAAGAIDWLVNNAGIAVSAPLLGRTDEGLDPFELHLDVNFHGARRVLEALLPDMLERGYGRVVNVASSAALHGYAYVSAYCASKHALLGYTRAAASELAREGIGVSAVCPYYVESPMLDVGAARIAAKTGRSIDAAREVFRKQNPGGRLITSDEVALVVLELLRGARTGVVVELDGGAPRELEGAPAPRA